MKCKIFIYFLQYGALVLTITYFPRIWSTLLFNSRHEPKIGFKDQPNSSYIGFMSTFVQWKSNMTKCSSFYRHDICIISLYDLPRMVQRHEFFANKLMLDFDPLAFQCMEDWYTERVALGDRTNIDLGFYCKFMQTHSSLVSCNNDTNKTKILI